MKTSLLSKKITKHTVIRQALRQAEEYYIDLTKIRKEMKTFLLFIRKVENMKIDLGFDIAFRNPNKDMERLAEKMMLNQSNRARAVEISIQLHKILNRLNYIYDNSATFINLEWAPLFSHMTKEAREAIIDNVFEDTLENIGELKTTVADLERIMRNMDSCHFVLKDIKEIGEGIIERSRV